MAKKKAATQAKISIPDGPKMVSGLRALISYLTGETLAVGQFADAEYAIKKLRDHLGPDWAQNLTKNQAAILLGIQPVQLPPIAGLGVDELNNSPVSLPRAFKQLYGLVATNRKLIAWTRDGGNLDKLQNDLQLIRDERDRLQDEIDELSSRDPSPSYDDGEPVNRLDAAKIRRTEALALQSELLIKERAAFLVPASEVEPILTITADRMRSAAEAIGAQYGPDAQKIIIKAIEDSERRLAELRQKLKTKNRPQSYDDEGDE